MKKIGKYCKAYTIAKLREYERWAEKPQYTRKESTIIDGVETDVARELKENDYLFLQEDFTVTDGIYLGENVVFDQVTPEWVEFCKSKLNFEARNYQTETRAASDNGATSA